MDLINSIDWYVIVAGAYVGAAMGTAVATYRISREKPLSGVGPQTDRIVSVLLAAMFGIAWPLLLVSAGIVSAARVMRRRRDREAQARHGSDLVTSEDVAAFLIEAVEDLDASRVDVTVSRDAAGFREDLVSLARAADGRGLVFDVASQSCVRYDVTTVRIHAVPVEADAGLFEFLSELCEPSSIVRKTRCLEALENDWREKTGAAPVLNMAIMAISMFGTLRPVSMIVVFLFADDATAQ